MPTPVYPLPIRLAHWINAVALIFLVMTGFEIFNAHPTLYFSDAADPERVVLKLSPFPDWATLGGWLAGARRLHFAVAILFIANGALYLLHVVSSRRRLLVWPTWHDWRIFGTSLRDHFRIPPILELPDGQLNPLQKASYLMVTCGLAPLVVLTGLALSPQWDALFPFWTDVFGGRQAARTWHFAITAAFLAFLAIHISMVALGGWNNLNRILSGRVVLHPNIGSPGESQLPAAKEALPEDR